MEFSEIFEISGRLTSSDTTACNSLVVLGRGMCGSRMLLHLYKDLSFGVSESIDEDVET